MTPDPKAAPKKQFPREQFLEVLDALQVALSNMNAPACHRHCQLDTEAFGHACKCGAMKASAKLKGCQAVLKKYVGHL
jgi:hypothetical protein